LRSCFNVACLLMHCLGHWSYTAVRGNANMCTYACVQAAEKARIEGEKAEAEARRLRAIAEREAKEAAEAEDARQLAALVAQAHHDAKRWTIGQRVRLKDGQVGTVANIRIAGATGLDWVRRLHVSLSSPNSTPLGSHVLPVIIAGKSAGDHSEAWRSRQIRRSWQRFCWAFRGDAL
jgi:hypothetical protein